MRNIFNVVELTHTIIGVKWMFPGFVCYGGLSDEFEALPPRFTLLGQSGEERRRISINVDYFSIDAMLRLEMIGEGGSALNSVAEPPH
jgi:hypothetical protein